MDNNIVTRSSEIKQNIYNYNKHKSSHKLGLRQTYKIYNLVIISQ